MTLLLTISDRCQASLRHGVVDARNAHHQPHLFVLPSFAHQPLLQFCDFQLGLFQQTQIAVTRLRFFFRQRQPRSQVSASIKLTTSQNSFLVFNTTHLK